MTQMLLGLGTIAGAGVIGGARGRMVAKEIDADAIRRLSEDRHRLANGQPMALLPAVQQPPTRKPRPAALYLVLGSCGGAVALFGTVFLLGVVVIAATGVAQTGADYAAPAFLAVIFGGIGIPIGFFGGSLAYLAEVRVRLRAYRRQLEHGLHEWRRALRADLVAERITPPQAVERIDDAIALIHAGGV